MKVLLFICLLFLLFSPNLSAELSSTVYIIPVHGQIDLGLSKFVGRVCKELKEKNVNLIILDINTSGGRVDAAMEICDSIAGLADIPTAAYIIGEACDEGALIALSCKMIIMASGGSIGSSEPEFTDEKTFPEIKTKIKALSEKNGHSVKLASAMVDKNIELILVKGENKFEILDYSEWEAKGKDYKEKVKSHTVLSPKGKLLNLNANEAKDLGLAKDIFNTKEEFLEAMGMKDARVIYCKLLWSESLVRFITHPIVTSLLLTIGFLGLIFELRIPGWGLSGTFSLVALGLFFLGYYLAGLADWAEIILFLAGIGLLFIEVFIIPNFKIIGISGIIIIVISLFLALIKNPSEIPRREFLGAFFIITYTFIVSLIIAIAGLKLLPRSHALRKLILPKES